MAVGLQQELDPVRALGRDEGQPAIAVFVAKGDVALGQEAEDFGVEFLRFVLDYRLMTLVTPIIIFHAFLYQASLGIKV